jgi:hypothetical protein
MTAQERRKQTRRTTTAAVATNRRQGERRQQERRGSPRVPLELWMEEATSNEVYFRRTGNVGLGGVYFDDAIPHDDGTEVTLKFTLPGDREMVVARGKVINKATRTNPLGMRVRFITIEGNGKDRIRHFIEKL